MMYYADAHVLIQKTFYHDVDMPLMSLETSSCLWNEEWVLVDRHTECLEDSVENSCKIRRQ